ncbi:MAG: GTPase domain-containing protein [Gemmataceae bacterium]
MTQATNEQQEAGAYRGLTSQLSEDLGWLEQHCRSHPGQAQQANYLRYAGGLVRNLIGPFLNNQPAEPLHVVVVGGAGAGKSTVANLLAGAIIAEANPQAGFTRHPVAYTASTAQVTWPAHHNFLGPLTRLSEPTPSNLDKDVYQVRRVPVNSDAQGLLQNFVVWDCPDMTTWVATGYIPRLIEVAALADLIVYVASDERYNDEVPTQFLKMLIQSHKPVIVVLTKMRESNAPAFIEHFKQEVIDKLGGKNVPCLALPHMTAEELADPLTHARRFQIPLLNQVQVLCSPTTAARQRSVRLGKDYLLSEQETLLGIAKSDLDALDTWRGLVQRGQAEFDNRYKNEYLAAEKFHRFDQALVKLLELLELPGIGKVISGALYVVRTPYRLLKNLFTRALSRAETPAVPERPVLERAIQGWIDMLHKESARRNGTHGLWNYINSGFQGELKNQIMARFEERLGAFHLAQSEEIERTARAIYEDLQNNPVALNTLRSTKFALEVGTIAGAVAMGGALNAFDLIFAPLAASLTQQLIELLGKSYVNAQKEKARARQQTLVAQHISGPLAGWLIEWPATGGSEFQRLRKALHQIPLSLHELNTAVNTEINERGEIPLDPSKTAVQSQNENPHQATGVEARPANSESEH